MKSNYKVISKNKHDIYGAPVFSPGACIIKLITTVIYGIRNKLVCLTLNTELGWKGLPGTNTLAYYRNHKLQP
jgi:hypothetical protein